MRWITRSRAVVIAVALLVGAAAIDGSTHRTVPPAEGWRLNGVSASEVTAPTLRIASFNIHGCRDADSHYDFDRTAGVLADFDLVGLNEVHGTRPWRQCDQAQMLGERLEMPWLFAPTTRRWWRDDFGNGLLCRLPVTHWRRIPLEGTRHKGHRNLVLAELEYGPSTIHLIVAHLDRVQDRQSQLRHTIDTFLALPEPAVLMGDLNTTAGDADLSRLLATPGVHDVVAEGLGHAPPKRIDWILARGLRGVRAAVVDTSASDHPLVWAEVEVAQ